jgi:hypothetical protein
MLKHLTILPLFLLIACGQQTANTAAPKETSVQAEKATSEAQPEVALNFINAYVENCNKMNAAVDMVEWVESNTLVTKSFKSALKQLVEEAFEADPEMGLDADPIFDAQDYPENGFVLDRFDLKNTLVHLKRNDSPEFKLRVKIVEQDGKWLVDGCGVVNMSKNH